MKITVACPILSGFVGVLHFLFLEFLDALVNHLPSHDARNTLPCSSITAAISGSFCSNKNTNFAQCQPQWTYVSGSSNPDQLGVYLDNIVGARQSPAAWISKNNFYIFGGFGYASTTYGNSFFIPIPNFYQWM